MKVLGSILSRVRALFRPRSRVAVAILLLAGLGIVTVLGWNYHRWVFDQTEGIRFVGDIRRNYIFGTTALDGEYLSMYEDQVRDEASMSTHQKIDYPPLRLGMFAAWVAWNRHFVTDPENWRIDYDFHAFLMCHNQILEWLGALAAFLIVRHWLREVARSSLPLGEEPPPWTGFVRASLAFLALWFDPGIAVIAHGWPSPNMWVVPYYLWAVYFCLRDRWFIAGAVMGVGALLQGQQLTVVAVFVLWPLFSLRPSRAFRWVCGFALFFTLGAAAWLLSLRPNPLLPAHVLNKPALAWLLGSLALLAAVGLRKPLAKRLHWALFLLPAIAAVCVIAYPAKGTPKYSLMLAAGSALAAAFWFTQWTLKRYLLPLSAALGLLACMPLWNATDAWWKIGFCYGTERFPILAFGNMSNLAAILQDRFGWRQLGDLALTIEPQTLRSWPSAQITYSIRELLIGIMGLLLVVSAAAIALQWRRRGKNLLIALVLPWVVFYTVAPQMSPRYPVFVSGVGAICLGASGGVWLIALMFSLLCVNQTMLCMFWSYHSDEAGFMTQDMARIWGRIHPGASWAVLLGAAIMLWLSFRVPGKRRKDAPTPAPSSHVAASTVSVGAA